MKHASLIIGLAFEELEEVLHLLDDLLGASGLEGTEPVLSGAAFDGVHTVLIEASSGWLGLEDAAVNSPGSSRLRCGTQLMSSLDFPRAQAAQWNDRISSFVKVMPT